MCSVANAIKKVDLHCHANNVAHNTHEISTSQLIVRRGQPFSITLELDFAFSTSESLKLTVETGRFPKPSRGTKCTFGTRVATCDVGTKALWSCSINATSSLQTGCVTLNVTPPADAPVGKYSLSIELGRPSAVKESLVVLFNPWCQNDWVYLPDEKERQEYVMNEQGHIYRGTAHCFSPMFWDFGQFEEEMVDICLKLLDVNPKHKRDPEDDVSARCNPIYVGRVISAMINCYDDMGVLQGCWDGNYHDGVCPTRWTSSVSILQRWFQSDCKAVKYGQCWVFAGVMCTVMRFFGIPCRVVTNFESGHDTNNSLTIDQYFDEYGLKKMGKEDSIWNFHVWVEGWMKRPDLDQDGRYDGWQVLDPTPQERSEGMFCCGPAPVSAIHDGHTNLKYDVPFVFSEVNADVVKWKIKADGSKIKMKYLTDTAKVGQKISTKAVGSTAINDLTNTYKYKEGCTMERVAFDNAVRRMNSPGHDVLHGTCEVLVVREVELSLEESCLRNSQDIKLNLKLSNRGHSVKSLSISVNAQVTNYTATKVKNVLHDSCFQRLNAGQVVNIPILIPYSAYCKYAVTHDSVKVSVDATDENGDIYETDTDITLEEPPISIKVLGEARLHHPVMVQVEFKNPLNETLRFCSLTISGSGLFRSEHFESIRELPANTTLTHQIQTTPYRAGLRTVVADFDCSAFRDVKDSCTVYVKP
ncbi:protein-glutamine gamma-glutamyltransferase E-like [Poecilia latipinna]|uniref:protein-glutamine gamma-glutamyltransferase E-like n=1 Tax=Poecilia latipinna TaxID=48699 RepID=UPI00072E3470|nr:PREDICTED: protein-glutamine gamma-glutamyltransferase E-like [Poecilia latipinna]